MKKTFLGSSKLNHSFKMFRIRYTHASESARIKDEVLQLMSVYLNDHDGKLINVKDLPSLSEILFYFITGEDYIENDWQDYFKNTLLKKYHMVTNVIQIGPHRY